MPQTNVTVVPTSGGYLPTMTWATADGMDREAYAMGFDDLATAERIGRQWAEQEGATYVPYEPIDPDAGRRHALLVKRLRETEGLGLADAIAKARRLEKEAA